MEKMKITSLNYFDPFVSCQKKSISTWRFHLAIDCSVTSSKSLQNVENHFNIYTNESLIFYYNFENFEMNIGKNQKKEKT